jgi:Cupin-like domain
MYNSLGIKKKRVRAYNRLWVMRNLMPIKSVKRKLEAKNERLLQKIRSETNFTGGVTEIDSHTVFDFDDFVNNYYNKGKPVVYRQTAANWACVKQWTPQYFIDHYGDYMLDVGDHKYSDEGGRVDSLPMREAVPLLQSDPKRYVRFSSFFTDNPALIEMIDPVFREKTKKLMLTKGSTQLFMGAAGTYTDLHAAMTNNMFVQINGRKEWLLFHPDNNPFTIPYCENSPTFRSKLMENELSQLYGLHALCEPGDMLYLPPFYWHFVRNHDFSIGMSYRWLAIKPSYRVSPVMTFLTAVATNPSPLLFMLDVKKGKSAPLFFRKNKKTKPSPLDD